MVLAFIRQGVMASGRQYQSNDVHNCMHFEPETNVLVPKVHLVKSGVIVGL